MFFKKKQKSESKVGMVGNDVEVYNGPPTGMTAERRHLRDVNRMHMCKVKMKELEDRGATPDDPEYESWSLEFMRRSISVREHNLRQRGV